MNYVKAFAIVAMVMGHANSPLNVFLYQYHMALFMFVSGYFYKDYYSEHPVKLVVKRIKSLWLPFAVYNVLFVFLINVLNYFNLINKSYDIFNIDNWKNMLKSILSFNSYADYLGGFWFVKTLFITTILFCAISFLLKRLKLEKEYYRFAIIVLIYIIEWFILYKDISISKNLIQAPMALPIFYMGYMYNKHKEKIVLRFPLVIFGVIILCFNSKIGSVNMDSLMYTGPIFYIVSSVTGIYVNVTIAYILEKRFGTVKYLNYIGENTYTILAFHLLFKDILYNFLDYLDINLGCTLWAVDVIVAVNASLLLHFLYMTIKELGKKYVFRKIENK